MTLVFHPADPRDGEDGEMKSYTVRVKTADKRVLRVLRKQGETDYLVSVFACGPHGALMAAVEKAHDKWLRHRGWDVTDWTPVDCGGN